jgi:hypothetical protein
MNGFESDLCDEALQVGDRAMNRTVDGITYLSSL